MLRERTIVFIGIILTFLLLGPAPAGLAASEVFPLDDLRPGMFGTGYTVVQGTRIDPFAVEILGVLPAAGPAGDLILVRVGGDVIDRIGGIAAGMSGSPVYLEGKLLGAISYGFVTGDRRIGLVTPAADMLKVLDLSLGRRDPASDAMPTAIVDTEARVAAPVATPLVISGFGPRTLRRLQEVMEGRNVVPMVGGASLESEVENEGKAPRSIQPGSAIGVQLMRGDLTITGIGTVTEVQDDGFVAFGHSFYSLGEVGFYAAEAEILVTVPSGADPFKIGVAKGVVGAVTQDRHAGIGGRFGDKPEDVRLTVRTHDLDRDVSTSLEVTAVREPDFIVDLLTIGALEGLDRGIDRIGEGTGWIEFTIHGEGLPRPVSRTNMFYSRYDISALSLVELYDGLAVLNENVFQDPLFTSVDVDVRIERGRHSALIVSATPSSKEVYPGDEVLVDVTLRAFREDPFTVTIPLSIPPDTPPGEVSVWVGGGGSYLGAYDAEGPIGEAPNEAGDDETRDEDLTRAESLDKLIEEFVTRPLNNELLIEFYPPYVGAPAEAEDDPPHEHDSDTIDGGDIEAADEGDPGRDPDEPVKASQLTEFVIEGETYFELTILSVEADEAPPADADIGEPEGSYAFFLE